MSINSINANNAYGFVQKAMNNSSTDSASGASGASGSSFAEMVGEGLKSAVDSVKMSEQVSTQAVTGNASLTDVVTAVNTADVALKSVVAIRDKVISAYQDILKMPI